MPSIKTALRKVTPLRASSYEKTRVSLEKKISEQAREIHERLDNVESGISIRSSLDSAEIAEGFALLGIRLEQTNKRLFEMAEQLSETLATLDSLGRDIQILSERIDALAGPKERRHDDSPIA